MIKIMIAVIVTMIMACSIKIIHKSQKLKNMLLNKLKNISRRAKNQGIVWGCISGIADVLQCIFEISVYRERKPEGNIFVNWKFKWNTINFDGRNQNLFYDVFCSVYKDTCKREKKNRVKNFRMKLLTLAPSIIISSVAIFYIVYYIIDSFINTKSFFKSLNEVKLENSTIYGTIVYILLLIVTIVIQQWIDVKQYQETWIRHHHHRFRMEIEMYNFIQSREKYEGLNSIECCKLFEKNILKILEENEEKFMSNMEREEKGVLNKLTSTLGGRK